MRLQVRAARAAPPPTPLTQARPRSRSVLEQTSVWGPKGRALIAKREAIQRRAGLPARGNLLYYGGKIHGQRGMEDPSGRAQLLLLHENRTGFRIQRSWDWVKLEPIATGTTYADEMPNATFCYCPLGHDSGDVDRYIPGAHLRARSESCMMLTLLPVQPFCSAAFL